MSSCTRCFGELSALVVFCPQCGQANAPAFDQLLNQTIAERYQIHRRLTGGGLSAVFVAADLQTQQPVVLKFSDPQHLTRREMTYALDVTEARSYWNEMLERMQHEAEMLLSLRHPHIVRLHDTGTLNAELRYLVLEYLEGETLHDAMLRQSRPTLADALRITLALAEALAHVHARGIVHRDLNPRNVMLTRQRDSVTERQRASHNQINAFSLSQVKLIDFGIAKFPQPPGAPPFTQHSLLRGTVAYASPEQCQNEMLDARSDLYSLGVLLYEMTTGQRPFNGRTPTEIALQQIQAAPVAPRKLNEELTPDLEGFILRAMAKHPADRPASAIAFAAELRAAARRIVIELPEPLLPTTVQNLESTAPTVPFHFTSLEHAAAPAPRRMLAKTLAATAALAIALLAGTGTPDFVKRLRGGTEHSPTNSSPLETTAYFPATEMPVNDSAAIASPTVAATAEPNAPDAFEAIAQPLRSWTTALSAKVRMPQNRSAKLPQTQPTSTAAPTALAPFVMAATPAIPPYAFPSAGTVYQPDLVVSSPPVALPGDQVTASIDLATAPPMRAARQPEPRRVNVSFPDDEDRESWRPRLISWTGVVRGERMLRIELPGQPGTVEIPSAFRHRVGIIEPPQPGNGWGCVRLRVIGRGAVNLVIRWWPKPS